VRTLREYQARRRNKLALKAVAAFITVFAVGAAATAGAPYLANAVPALASASIPVGQETFTCTVASITDGDTFRCEEHGADGRAIRIRLSGVAAREADNSCSPGHPCPDASAASATAALSQLAARQQLQCRQVGKTYNRVAAFCTRSDGVDLSCAMVDSGTVLKWRKHWGWHRC
jgi:endonuclease YncB( thermonuclease family)